MLTINNTLDGYLKYVEIKGNTIQDASNLADIRSVGDTVEGQELYEIPVLSRGKNLCPYNSVNFGSMSYNDRLKKYPFILPKGTYKLSFKQGDTGGAIFDNNGVKLNDSSTMIFTIDNTQIVYFYGNQNINYVDIQLEEGTVATPYEPYQEDKLTILSPTPLEKVGDVADRIICKDGIWGVEKNVDTLVFDGSESWLVDSEENRIVLYGMDNKITTRNKNQLCNIRANYSSYALTPNTFDLSTDYLRLSNDDNFTLAQEVKDYFKQTNLKIMYQTTNPQFIPLPHDQQVKLRTFASKTNISFLTEIEGTIKAQVPKSLGATVNTHTEQINNLNNELNRVKKLEESTVSTVTTESDFTTVEATSNGYFEDVKLEGKTLVNLSTLKEKFVISANSELNYIAWFNPNQNLKAGKVYTLIYTAENVNETVNTLKCRQYGIGITSLWNHKKLPSNKGNGIFMFTFEPTEDYINIGFYFDKNFDDTTSTATISNVIILEGDHTQNPPSYFEGLKSVGQSASEDGADEIVVSSVNENLFSANSIIEDSTNILVYTNLKNNKPNYIFNNTTKTIVIDIYSISAETWLRQKVMVSNSNFELQLDNDEYVKRVRFLKSDGWSFDLVKDNLNNISIKVDNKNSYTPHQADKKRLLYYNNETQTWEKPILRQWDSIEKHSDGKYYYHQRSGEVVLNGSEEWDNNANKSQPTTYRQSIILNSINMPNATINTKTSPSIISDLLPTVVVNDIYITVTILG